MFLSILTPTYNRGNLISNLYKSIIENLNAYIKNTYITSSTTNVKEDMQIEWIIMDDGSTDNTSEIIHNFIKENKIKIQYHFQNNQGKMKAINEITNFACGELVVECDSDDIFAENSFKKIKKAYDESKKEKDLYALCFLKFDLNGNNIGELFKTTKTTMFDLYFKQKENGEKALVYFKKIRKKFTYILEEGERFSTEARMHHRMDLDYKIKCYNEPIMICEYQKDGYTKNIVKIFKENPKGYYEYFKEIFEQNMKGTIFSKRLYVIKHYILFSYLTKQKHMLKNVKGVYNKILTLILYIPGIIKSKRQFSDL